ncbi:MAG: hypothetical protein GEU28_02665 [Dehalococcoidia bacterium]|nr:hypothetical protein [Dehalococcoidia bacterium]
MNKLRDRIRKATSVAPAPLGFGAQSRKKESSLLLLARGEKYSAVAQYIDGFMATSAKSKPGKEVTDRLVAGTTIDDGRDAVRAAAAAGYDFVVVSEDAPASALLEEDVAYLMPAPVDASDALLRALEPMALDGLLVAPKASITVREQLELVRLAAFARKPLFVSLDSVPESADIEVLREVGTVALLLDASRPAADFEALRRLIDELPARRRSRERDSIAATIPSSAPASDDEHDHDHDD